MSESGENSGPYGGAPGMRDDAAAPFRGKEKQSSNPVLAFAMSRFNSKADALNWYRTTALSEFGGATPEALVREGRSDDVMATIKAAEDGVYA